MTDDSSRRLLLAELLAFTNTVQSLGHIAELRQGPGGESDGEGKLEEDVPRPNHRDPVLDEWACLHPVALEEMERARGPVGHSDRERTMRLLREPDRLGSILHRLGESAELGEASD